MDKGIKELIADIRLKHDAGDVYAPILRWDEFEMLAAAINQPPHHNAMMQLSNELAEMKRKCSELESRQFNEVELRELLTWRYTERSASMDPLLWAAMRNKIILTIEELNTAGGTVEGVE